MFDEDIRMAELAPERWFVFVGGDFSFHAPGEAPIKLASPQRAETSAPLVAPPGPYQSTWQSILCRLTEVEQGDARRFDHGSLSTSRLDRLYTSIPAWALLNCEVSAAAALRPRQA